VAKQKINLAVLFADVSDSTRLYKSLGDTAAFGNVRQIIELLKSTTGAFGGARGEDHWPQHFRRGRRDR